MQLQIGKNTIAFSIHSIPLAEYTTMFQELSFHIALVLQCLAYIASRWSIYVELMNK